MKTQQDSTTRVVALVNLEAMCEEASGFSHRYQVTKVSRSRVHVEYSNPDEYGHEAPMTAVFPCYPSSWQGDEENPRVVLDILRVLNDSWEGEGWQAFQAMLDMTASRAGLDGAEWRTVPFESGAHATAHMKAMHRAYHDRYDNGELCQVCRD